MSTMGQLAQPCYYYCKSVVSAFVSSCVHAPGPRITQDRRFKEQGAKQEFSHVGVGAGSDIFVVRGEIEGHGGGIQRGDRISDFHGDRRVRWQVFANRDHAQSWVCPKLCEDGVKGVPGLH